MGINEIRVNQHIRNFERVIQSYSYTEPLSRYLTKFFKENKQMGSSDRRMTSRFCYNYFRLGNSLRQFSTKERLVFAEYLCENDSAVVSLYEPTLEASINKSVCFKVDFLRDTYGFNIKEVFPFVDCFSQAVDAEIFLMSQFVQPDLFIRIKRGKEKYLQDVFFQHKIDFTILSQTTLALPNGTKLQKVANLEGLFEVQDLSSQKTISFIEAKPNQQWWDACAASGGKSLMLLDECPEVNLLVSDKRLTILRNLDERFDKAGIRKPYRKKILDLTNSVSSFLSEEEFDGIIVDAPCSGSGTWGRTPEMIQQFDLEKLLSFAELQKNIVSNVLPHLKTGGTLVYITCSIYKNENEDIVNYLLDNYELTLDRMSVIAGYKNKADSMFAARFIKR